MDAIEKATATQLANISVRTGLPLHTLVAAIQAQALEKHGEMVSWVKSVYGLGHGDANTLVHLARRSAEGTGSEPQVDPADTIYSGPKAHQRPIHDQLMAAIQAFGPFEVAPKKGYISLRRSKQFATLGPKTNERFELGLNLKGQASHPRMKAMPPGGMCQYVVALHSPEEIDAALLEIARRAYEASA